MTTQDDAGRSAGASEGTVMVTETSARGFTRQISAGHHQLVADEPPPVGNDTGSTPYDLVLAGLGACTSMTVRMYADRKRWPLDKIRVTLRHSRIHANDCADCETTNGYIDQIDCGVELSGDLDDAQRQRLLYIAERCPVHQTLTSEVRITTSLS
ncbi:MAG: putative redox protein [Mycobacterium sp.]|nr:putative redox protein [Mycobacterium sp.]